MEYLKFSKQRYTKKKKTPLLQNETANVLRTLGYAKVTRCIRLEKKKRDKTCGALDQSLSCVALPMHIHILQVHAVDALTANDYMNHNNIITAVRLILNLL